MPKQYKIILPYFKTIKCFNGSDITSSYYDLTKDTEIDVTEFSDNLFNLRFKAYTGTVSMWCEGYEVEE